MKTISKALFLWGLIFIILSCTHTAEEKTVLNFTREDFKTNIALSNPQEIILENGEEITDPVAYYLLHDSFIVVSNQTHCNSFADLYSLKSRKVLAQLAPKGRGPGEFLAFRPVISSNEDQIFYATDGRLYYTVDANSTLKNYKLNMLDSLEYYNENIHPNTDICLTGPKTYAAYNLWYSDVPEYNPDNIPPLTFYAAGSTVQNPRKEKHSYFPGQINGAVLFREPQTGRIWVADNHKDIIHIYDDSLRLVKTVTGPDYYTPAYSTVSTPAFTMVTYKNGQHYRSYSSYVLAKDRIYLVYEGINGKNATDFEQQPLPASEIFVFDRQGNPETRYTLDKYIYTVSVSSDGKNLYCTSRDSLRSNARLYRYSL